MVLLQSIWELLEVLEWLVTLLNSSKGKDVPAHRVVNRKGLLTGKLHFPGTNLMQQLLENEGVKVVDNQIQDFEAFFWDPSQEL